MRRLGITRQLHQLRDLIVRATGKGIEVIPLPIAVTESIAYTWPLELGGATPDWILFTSANAVESFFARANELNVTFKPRTRFAVVGSKTGTALAKAGFEASFTPREAYGQHLFEEFLESIWRKNETVMYARGEEISFDPSPLFASLGVSYYPVICYRSVEQEVEPRVIEQFTEDDYILFTAPSTVRAYHSQYGQPKARVIAIGHTTGAEMTKAGWLGFSWLSQPDVDLVLEFI